MQLRVAASLAVTCALLSGLPASAAQVVLGARVPIQTGVPVLQPVPADMDGDGDLDVLAYQLGGTPQVVWYENTAGNGSAWAAPEVVASLLAARLLAADVDADGDLDVVVANDSTDALVWYENLGAGASFASAVAIASSVGVPLAAADFDRDGDLDLAYAANATPNIRWARNLGGGGSWTSGLNVGTAGTETWSDLRTGDIDGDGDADVVAGQDGGDERVAWFRNNGSGVFSGALVLAEDLEFPSIALGDFDRDGDLDITASSGETTSMRFFQNSAGDGTSWNNLFLLAPSPTGTDLEAVDLDLDGDLDLVAPHQTGVRGIENVLGDATSWQIMTASAMTVMDFGVGDIDGDGDPDVLSASEGSDVIGWLENLTPHRSAIFPLPGVLDVNADFPGWVSAGDLDQDGDPDALVITTGTTGSLRWRANDGDGGFGPANLIASLTIGRIARVADVDRDGDPDVVTAATLGSPARLVWHENTAGDASAWTPHSISTTYLSPYHADVGDIDGDGDLDVLASSSEPAAARVDWFENTAGNGSAWTQHAMLAAQAFPSDVRLADVDADGDLDAFYTELGFATIGWLENTAGNGSAWTNRLIENGGATTGPNTVEPADVDGDGDLDVVVASKLSNDSAWFANANGSGTSWTRHGLGAPARLDWLRAADLDLDGDVDLAAASGDSDTLYVFENDYGDGSGWTVMPLLANLLDVPLRIDAADFDRDGDPDLIATAQNSGDLVWLRNEGGQFGLPTDSVAYAGMVEQRVREVLRIDVAHRGRAGDPSLQLESIELHFEDDTFAPLGDAQVAALLSSIELRAGSPAGPILATDDPPFALVTGGLTLPVPPSGANVFAAGTTTSTWLRLNLTPGASAATPSQFRVLHRAATAAAIELDYALPLTREQRPDIATGMIQALSAEGDADSDGLTNAAEADTHFTDPGAADTDGDQVGDGVEVNSLGTDPLDHDTDNDGLMEGDEVFLTIDPLDPDSDADGFCDGLLSPGGCTAGDNCPAISNAPQTNTDAFVAGDVCQCGNVDGAGALSATDYLRAREHTVNRSPSGAFDEDFCDLNADTECDVADLAILQRAVAGQSAPLQNACDGYRGL